MTLVKSPQHGNVKITVAVSTAHNAVIIFTLIRHVRVVWREAGRGFCFCGGASAMTLVRTQNSVRRKEIKARQANQDALSLSLASATWICTRTVSLTRALSLRALESALHSDVRTLCLECALLLAISGLWDTLCHWRASGSRYQYAWDSRNFRETWMSAIRQLFVGKV